MGNTVQAFIQFTKAWGAIALLCGFFQLFSPDAQARPEYAAKNGIVNCAACHVNPFGAGIRNVNGKLYQTRNLGPSGTSMIDWFQGDARFIGILPNKPSREGRAAGIVLMSTIVSANAPISENQETGGSTSFVAAYDMGFLNPNKVRDAFLLYRPVSAADTGWVTSVMFGRYQIIPYGLQTDEHRTYVRAQTKTAFHQDQEFGVAVGGDPQSNIHYDLALLYGEGNNAGTAFKASEASLTYGYLANVRYNPLPTVAPGFVGLSYRGYSVIDAAYRPWSAALYGAFSAVKLTKGRVPLTLLAEMSLAHGYNDSGIIANGNIGLNFTGSLSSLQEAVKNSVSRGYYVEADYDLTNRWTLMYKLDYLALDRHFTGDAFYRHGFGFRFAVNSATSFWARYEISEAKRAFFTDENSRAERDNVLMVLHVSL